MGFSHVCCFDAGGPTVAGSDTGIGAGFGGWSADDPAGTGGTNDTGGNSDPGGGFGEGGGYWGGQSAMDAILGSIGVDNSGWGLGGLFGGNGGHGTPGGGISGSSDFAGGGESISPESFISESSSVFTSLGLGLAGIPSGAASFAGSVIGHGMSSMVGTTGLGGSLGTSGPSEGLSGGVPTPGVTNPFSQNHVSLFGTGLNAFVPGAPGNIFSGLDKSGGHTNVSSPELGTSIVSDNKGASDQIFPNSGQVDLSAWFGNRSETVQDSSKQGDGNAAAIFAVNPNTGHLVQATGPDKGDVYDANMNLIGHVSGNINGIVLPDNKGAPTEWFSYFNEQTGWNGGVGPALSSTNSGITAKEGDLFVVPMDSELGWTGQTTFTTHVVSNPDNPDAPPIVFRGEFKAGQPIDENRSEVMYQGPSWAQGWGYAGSFNFGMNANNAVFNGQDDAGLYSMVSGLIGSEGLGPDQAFYATPVYSNSGVPTGEYLRADQFGQPLFGSGTSYFPVPTNLQDKSGIIDLAELTSQDPEYSNPDKTASGAVVDLGNGQYFYSGTVFGNNSSPAPYSGQMYISPVWTPGGAQQLVYTPQSTLSSLPEGPKADTGPYAGIDVSWPSGTVGKGTPDISVHDPNYLGPSIGLNLSQQQAVVAQYLGGRTQDQLPQGTHQQINSQGTLLNISNAQGSSGWSYVPGLGLYVPVTLPSSNVDEATGEVVSSMGGFPVAYLGNMLATNSSLGIPSFSSIKGDVDNIGQSMMTIGWDPGTAQINFGGWTGSIFGGVPSARSGVEATVYTPAISGIPVFQADNPHTEIGLDSGKLASLFGPYNTQEDAIAGSPLIAAALSSQNQLGNISSQFNTGLKGATIHGSTMEQPVLSLANIPTKAEAFNTALSSFLKGAEHVAGGGYTTSDYLSTFQGIPSSQLIFQGQESFGSYSWKTGELVNPPDGWNLGNMSSPNYAFQPGGNSSFNVVSPRTSPYTHPNASTGYTFDPYSTMLSLSPSQQAQVLSQFTPGPSWASEAWSHIQGPAKAAGIIAAYVGPWAPVTGPIMTGALLINTAQNWNTTPDWAKALVVGGAVLGIPSAVALPFNVAKSGASIFSKAASFTKGWGTTGPLAGTFGKMATTFSKAGTTLSDLKGTFQTAPGRAMGSFTRGSGTSLEGSVLLGDSRALGSGPISKGFSQVSRAFNTVAAKTNPMNFGRTSLFGRLMNEPLVSVRTVSMKAPAEVAANLGLKSASVDLRVLNILGKDYGIPTKAGVAAEVAVRSGAGTVIDSAKVVRDAAKSGITVSKSIAKTTVGAVTSVPKGGLILGYNALEQVGGRLSNLKSTWGLLGKASNTPNPLSRAYYTVKLANAFEGRGLGSSFWTDPVIGNAGGRGSWFNTPRATPAVVSKAPGFLNDYVMGESPLSVSFSSLKGMVNSGMSKISDVVSKVSSAPTPISKVAETVVPPITQVASTVVGPLADVAGTVLGPVESLAHLAEDAEGNIESLVIETAEPVLGSAAKSVGTAISDEVKSVGTVLASMGKTTGSAPVSAVEAIADQLVKGNQIYTKDSPGSITLNTIEALGKFEQDYAGLKQSNPKMYNELGAAILLHGLLRADSPYSIIGSSAEAAEKFIEDTTTLFYKSQAVPREQWDLLKSRATPEIREALDNFKALLEYANAHPSVPESMMMKTKEVDGTVLSGPVRVILNTEGIIDPLEAEVIAKIFIKYHVAVGGSTSDYAHQDGTVVKTEEELVAGKLLERKGGDIDAVCLDPRYGPSFVLGELAQALQTYYTSVGIKLADWSYKTKGNGITRKAYQVTSPIVTSSEGIKSGGQPVMANVGDEVDETGVPLNSEIIEANISLKSPDQYESRLPLGIVTRYDNVEGLTVLNLATNFGRREKTTLIVGPEGKLVEEYKARAKDLELMGRQVQTFINAANLEGRTADAKWIEDKWKSITDALEVSKTSPSIDTTYVKSDKGYPAAAAAWATKLGIDNENVKWLLLHQADKATEMASYKGDPRQYQLSILQSILRESKGMYDNVQVSPAAAKALVSNILSLLPPKGEESLPFGYKPEKAKAENKVVRDLENKIRSFFTKLGGFSASNFVSLPWYYLEGGLALADKIYRNPAVLRKMGIPESDIRSILADVKLLHDLNFVRLTGKTVELPVTRYLEQKAVGVSVLQAAVDSNLLQGGLGGSVVIATNSPEGIKGATLPGDLDYTCKNEESKVQFLHNQVEALNNVFGEGFAVLEGSDTIKLGSGKSGNVIQAHAFGTSGDSSSGTAVGALGFPFDGQVVPVTYVLGSGQPLTKSDVNYVVSGLLGLKSALTSPMFGRPRDAFKSSIVAYKTAAKLTSDPDVLAAALLANFGNSAPVTDYSGGYVFTRDLEAAYNSLGDEGPGDVMNFVWRNSGWFTNPEMEQQLRSLLNPENQKKLDLLLKSRDVILASKPIHPDMVNTDAVGLISSLFDLPETEADALVKVLVETGTLVRGSTSTHFWNKGNRVYVHTPGDLDGQTSNVEGLMDSIERTLGPIVNPSGSTRVRELVTDVEDQSFMVEMPDSSPEGFSIFRGEIIVPREKTVPFGFSRDEVVEIPTKYGPLKVVGIKSHLGDMFDTISKLSSPGIMGPFASKPGDPISGRVKDLEYLREYLGVLDESNKLWGEPTNLVEQFDNFLKMPVGANPRDYVVAGTDLTVENFNAKYTNPQERTLALLQGIVSPRTQRLIENAYSSPNLVKGLGPGEKEALKIVQEALGEGRSEESFETEDLSKSELRNLVSKTLLATSGEKLPGLEASFRDQLTRVIAQINTLKGQQDSQGNTPISVGTVAYNPVIGPPQYRNKAYDQAFKMAVSGYWYKNGGDLKSAIDQALVWARSKPGYDPGPILQEINMGNLNWIDLNTHMPVKLGDLLEGLGIQAESIVSPIRSVSKSLAPETAPTGPRTVGVTPKPVTKAEMYKVTQSTPNIGSGRGTADLESTEESTPGVATPVTGTGSTGPYTGRPYWERPAAKNPLGYPLERYAQAGLYSLASGYGSEDYASALGSYPETSYGNLGYNSPSSRYSNPYSPKYGYGYGYNYGYNYNYGYDYGPGYTPPVNPPYSPPYYPPPPNEGSGSPTGGLGRRKKPDSTKKVILETKPVPWNVGETTPAGGTPWELNQVAKIEAIPLKEGWKFNHWEGDIPLVDSNKNPATVLMFKDRKCRAVFTKGPTVKLVDMGPNNIQVFLPKVNYKENVLTERQVFNLGGKERPLTRRNPAAYGEPYFRDPEMKTSRYVRNAPVNQTLRPEVTRV